MSTTTVMLLVFGRDSHSWDWSCRLVRAYHFSRGIERLLRIIVAIDQCNQ